MQAKLFQYRVTYGYGWKYSFSVKIMIYDKSNMTLVIFGLPDYIISMWGIK